MARYKGSLGRPIQGMSQQPYKNRLKGQCTDSINMRPDIVRGLTTRAGSKFITNLPYAVSDTDYIMHYKRDEVEEYFLVIPSDTTTPIWGVDKDGVLVSIAAQPTGAMRDYIFKTGVERGLSHLTIADSTLIANANVNTAMKTTKTPLIQNIGIVYCQFINYTQNHNVFINGELAAAYQSAVGDMPQHKESVRTSAVARSLANNLNSYHKGLYKAVDRGNCVFITRTDGQSFDLTCTDSADGGNLIAVKDTVTDVSKLPIFAPPDFTVKVLAKGGQESTAFYVKAHTKEFGEEVIWKECAAPDTLYQLDPATLPCMLVRDSVSADGKATFKFEYPSWVDRGAGDDDSNAQPQFVGKSITSMSLMQNRLVMTAGEGISMSSSNEYFSFFKSTTKTVLDSDPYEVYCDSTNIVELRNPISFNGDLFYFAYNSQVGLQGQDIITANEPKPLRQMSSFDVQEGSFPVAAGENIFFAFDYGRFTGIREYFTDSITDTKRAVPITDHVNQLIEGNIRHMATSNSINMLGVLATDPSTLYVYDWMWQGQEKVQAAWGKWKFSGGAKINYFVFSGSILRMIQTVGNKARLVEFDLGLAPDEVDVRGTDFSFAMDQRVKTQATRNADGSWLIPKLDALSNHAFHDMVFVQASGFGADIGTEIDVEQLPDGTFFIPVTDFGTGDRGTVDIIAGIRIYTKYTPSNPFIPNSDGTPTSGLDRLQVGSLYVNYDSAGPCIGTIDKVAGKTREVGLFPRVIGNGLNFVGFTPINEGVYKVPIRDKASQYTFSISTFSTKPLQIREVEYDCNVHIRGGEI